MNFRFFKNLNSGLWVSFALALFIYTPSVQAGVKVFWKTEIFQVPGDFDEKEILVDSFDSVAAQLASGRLIELSPRLRILTPNGDIENLTGHLEVRFLKLKNATVYFRVSAWDRTGLPKTSPYYRGWVSGDFSLRSGELLSFALTHGNVMDPQASARYRIQIGLQKIVTCDEKSTCHKL